ncbi:MAG: ABC transporter permease [Chitinivibrionales bacterium]|nr:ABC transporter permease [Chitinivibrionales bacterium]
MPFITSYIEHTGANAIARIRQWHGIGALLYDTIVSIIATDRKSHQASWRQIVFQILFTGVEAMGLVSIIGLFCGVTIVIQAMTTMPKFGASEYFGNLMVIIVVRELGPFFTALVVLGRSGSGLAAYIGTMRVNKEIAALEVMGIDPVHFVVMPAFTAMVAAIICLSVYFDLIAIIGGLFVAAVVVHVPAGIFLTKVIDALTVTDILMSFVKNTLFGSLIAAIACFHGLAVNNNRQVPQATIRAVVGSMIAIIVVNVIVTVGFYIK